MPELLLFCRSDETAPEQLLFLRTKEKVNDDSKWSIQNEVHLSSFDQFFLQSVSCGENTAPSRRIYINSYFKGQKTQRLWVVVRSNLVIRAEIPILRSCGLIEGIKHKMDSLILANASGTHKSGRG